VGPSRSKADTLTAQYRYKKPYPYNVHTACLAIHGATWNIQSGEYLGVYSCFDLRPVQIYTINFDQVILTLTGANFLYVVIIIQ